MIKRCGNGGHLLVTLCYSTVLLFFVPPVSASILPRPYLWQQAPGVLSLRENSTVSHADADRQYKNQSSTIPPAQHDTKGELIPGKKGISESQSI